MNGGARSDGEADVDCQLLGYSADDEGNALSVMALFPGAFCYAPAFGWLHYTGTHWERDEGEAQIGQAIMATLKQRRRLAAASKEEEIVKCTPGSAKRVNDCKQVLRPKVTRPASDFADKPWELNVANGVLNLRTGELGPHAPEHQFLYCLDVAYDPEADDAAWRAFLTENIAGGAEVLEVVQASMGYWITGETAEEKVWYLHGKQRAGKGTAMETLQALLGPRLFGTAQFNTFTKERDGNDQGFDLAGFHAARLVFAEESNRNDYLNPGRVKAWTGGGTIKCAFKHRDQFEYKVHWKGVLASNYPLNTDANDDGLWARVQIWYFPNSYEGIEDLTLKEQMRTPAYLAGVLRFLVEGARAWYKLKLKGGLLSITPGVMLAHKRAIREELDPVGRWLEENCACDTVSWTANEALHADFSQYCKDNGQKPFSSVSLGKLLAQRGFTPARGTWRGRQCRGFAGIRLVVNP